MLKSVRYLVVGLILSMAAATSAFAQNHPMPGAKGAAPVICTGCPWTNASGQDNDGLPTYPYSGVLINHVGRYVDSSSTQSYQMWANAFRTARARYIRVAPTTRGTAPPRVYIQIGNAMMAYSLDTFFTTDLPGGMIPLVNKFGGVGGGREKILDYDAFVYPEYASSGWQTDGGDFQDPMAKAVPFDYDDRGNVYVATEKFGWAIVADDGRTSGGHLAKVIQFVATPNPQFSKVLANTSKVKSEAIISIKTGGTYYTIIADRDSQMAVFDSTNTSRPVLTSTRIGDKKNAVRAMARDDNTKRVAYIDNNFQLRVFDYDSLVQGGAPIAEYTADGGGAFGEVVSMDEAGNIWTVEAGGKIWKLTPSGNTYTKTTYSPFPERFQPLMMNVSAGYMAIGGIDWAASTYDVKVLRIESNGVTNLNIDNFFRKYYHQAPAGYAQPGSYTAIQAQSADIEIVKWGGKTYLMYSGFGIGDVFELEGGNSINIAVKSGSFGTPNPRTPASAAPGPYYGDHVTFTSTSSSASVAYDVQWNFANPEAGTGNTGRRSRTGSEIIHQYTGITTAAGVTAVKPVQAQTVQDPNIRATLNLSLKLPTPRVGAETLPAPITASTTGLHLLAGESFFDASDGSADGHVSKWNIDGTTTSLEPLQPMPTGEVGPHTLQFRGAYGANTNLQITNPYETPLLSIGYTVLPFKATINAPTASGTNVTFTATAFKVGNTNIMSATTWDIVWTLNGAPVLTALGETFEKEDNNKPGYKIKPLVVPSSSITDGSEIGLRINVDPTKLIATAAAYAQFTTSLKLSSTDPDIEMAGCANANSPCKFTARSAGSKSMAGWTYLWTLTRPSGNPLTGTAATFEPTISAPGNYTITLKATTGIFSAEVSKQFTAAGSLCGQLPQSHTVGISKVGCPGSCAPGTEIEFAPTFLGYARQACDTYSWNMGDGNTRNTEVVRYSYSTPGNYTVTLTMSNSGSPTPVVKTTTVTISNGTTDPPPTNVCTAPVNITVSATCNGGSTCRTSDTVTFTARRGGAGLQTCDNVTWNFGDGSAPSTTRQPQKQYASAGTYTVSAVVSNSVGTAPAATTQVTIADPSGNCSIAPSISNFVIEYVGPTTNCRGFNSTPCNAGEAVAFSAPNYYYVVGSCDTFEWDFDDGTKSTNRNPTHSFSGGRDYNVKLTVRNNAGFYTYNRTVKVAGTTPTQPLPVITPTTFPANARKGQAVTFVATSNMVTTTGWTWNFGDGTAADTSQAGLTGATSTISHTFATAGTYTVKVSARNSTDAATAPVGEAQANITITNAPAIPEYRYLLPVTAYTAGQGGSAWRTDVQIFNPDPQVSEAKPLVMEATFKGITKTLTMIKATHIYENFLGNLLDLQKEDQGPVIITTKSAMTPPHIWTRTYTQTPNGTFGQFIPAIRIDNVGGGAATGDGKYYMAGLRHDARYRTNVGFLNPNAAPINVTVTVYDAAKFKIADFPLTLQPFQLEQYPLTSKVSNLPNDKPFSVKIEVPAGNWIVAYASSLDGFSNDGVYVQAVPESDVASADYKTTILPGVGHVGQWRSDVTIFNPDPDGVMFDLTYYNSLGEKKAEALSVPLESGKFLQYSDILKQGVLGNVDDGLGTLKVTVKDNHEKYPMTFARTYFDNGANGTFGQGIPAFSPARANVKAGQAAIIAGVRNSAAYRTNIGLVNVSSSNVVATVTLLDPTTGAAVKAVQYTIRPAETIVGPFAGTAAQPRGDWNGITTATLKIEANGALWAFASCVDMETQDPEYVVATPFINQ